MQSLFHKLFFVSVDDANLARSMRSLMILALAQAFICVIFFPIAFFPTLSYATLSILSTCFVVFLGSYFLARSGRVGIATTLLIGVISLSLLGSVVATQQINSAIYLCSAVIIASMTLRPLQVWAVVVANIIGVLLVRSLIQGAEFDSIAVVQVTIINSIALLIVAGIIGSISARELGTTVVSLQHARHAADRANADLALANASLETRVAERTAELDTALVSQRALNSDLHDSLAAQQQLNQIIADLSLPIIPVRADTIIVPLTGAIDSARADQLISNVLTRLETGQVQLVILDVTGVPIVDTQVAQALIRTAEAAKLMGTRTMLVGIRPEVAQTLVGLGINLGELRTAATLQSGLEQAQHAAVRRAAPRTAV